MPWLWRMGVCLGMIALYIHTSDQQSPSSLFLVSVPEKIYAGIPASLAVTVVADFNVVVTVEVGQGDNRVEKSEDFTEDMTRLFTLPTIYDSPPNNSPLTLTVRGYKGDEVIFSNTTTVAFSPRNVSTFTQVSKTRCQPGDSVRIRVASVYLDNYPYRGQVELSVTDPDGNIVDRFESSGNNGIVSHVFTLSQSAPLGLWTVTTTINGLTDHLEFLVEDFENPPFEVLIKMPPHVLTQDDILGSVRALYSSGQPVHGTVVVTFQPEPAADVVATFKLTQTKEIYGSTQIHFNKDDLEPLIEMVQKGKDVTVYVHAVVTSNAAVNKGIEVTKEVKVQVFKEMFQLKLHDYPQTLMPGMEFSVKLKVSRFDLEPLSSEDVEDVAIIEVTQRNSTHDGEPTPFTLAVPPDGIVHLSFRLHAGVEDLFIQATFQSSIVTLHLSKTHLSPTGSFIYIPSISSTQVESPVDIHVKSSIELQRLHYVVRSRGQVVAAGTKTSGSFSLTPTASWVPQACVTVYCVLADGEVVSATAHMVVEQNKITLSWSHDEAQPGQQVTLSLTGPESGSEVGLVVMGTHDSAPELSQQAEGEQECNNWMLTNGELYETKTSAGSNQNADMIRKQWQHFMNEAEPLLWLDATMRGSTWTSEKITVPDGVNSLRAAVIVIFQRQWLSITSQTLPVSKYFSLLLNVPPQMTRREEIVLEVNIINHLNRELEVILLLAESDSFEFVMAQRGSVSTVNAQKWTLGSYVSAVARFPIRLIALGEVDISVDAVSAEASESLVWTVLVKPEGIEESVSKSLFFEMHPTMNNLSKTAAFSFPEEAIPDSRRVHVAIGGDILALSVHQMDSLVDLPLGCGEHNMVHFAPSIYVLKYLKSSQDDASIRSRLMRHLEEGYRQQLSYQRSDGSFGACGDSESSGSTWLTAFVVKSLHQAQDFITVDQGVLTKARDWLLSQQGAQGQFLEGGTVMHTGMQGGQDNGPVALTAYALIALLEHQATTERYADKIAASVVYLENKVTEEISNYSLALTAYALSLASSLKVSTALTKLRDRADTTDGVNIWMSSSGPASDDNSTHSVQIEIAGYILLTYSNRGDILEAIPLMKWLTVQRNHLGGFGGTQGTVVAVQALSEFAVFSGAFAIDLRLKLTSPTTSFMSTYQINSTNYRAHQGQELAEIDVNKHLNFSIYLEGRGFATFQMNVFYSVDSQNFSENLENIMNEEAFLLNVELYAEGEGYDQLQMSVCMRLKDAQSISKTGMAILDVGLLSGFTISGAKAPTELIPKIEVFSDKVILYIRSLNTTQVCVTIPFIRIYKVAHTQDAVVRVYDFYEPMRKATRMYNLDDLHTLDPCVFCGEDCELCMPGLSITVSGILSHSVISATYSLTCLLVTALLLSV